MIGKFMLAASALAFTGSVALAQDYTQPAAFGTVTLNAGFSPDPHGVEMVAGGDIDASTLGNNCRGFIANAPDYEVVYTPGSFPLHFAFVSPTNTDTTLVINGPDGQWYCDDDSLSFPNPLVTFETPLEGTYDVWVGVYNRDATDRSGTLYVTELDPAGLPGAGNQPPPSLPPPPVTQVPDPTLPPAFGEVTLQAGIPVPPVELIAGGDIDAYAFNTECAGYIAQAPDYVVNFQTLAGILPLVIAATSQADTTLVVADPGGTFHCDDDTNGANPEVRFDGPQGGRYAIWVGTYINENANATLTITTPGGLGGAGGGVLPKPPPGP